MTDPGSSNALSFGVLKEVVDAFEIFDKDERDEPTILIGNDDAFSAGPDIKDLSKATPVDLIHRKMVRPKLLV